VTDDVIDFEDLMVFVGNDEVVSAPALNARGIRDGAGTPEQFRVVAPALVDPGQTVAAKLRLDAAGRMQGFSVRLAWDPNVVEPVGMQSGQFIESQGGIVLSPRPGTVDAALLGTRAVGVSGAGEVATIAFRTLRVGDAGIRIAQVIARDAANHPIDAGAMQQASQSLVPVRTELLSPAPNPFQGSASLVFSMAQSGSVDLAVYSVDGRRVRTLVRERRDAGVYRESWDGQDQGRHPVAPGVYYAHLRVAGMEFTKSLVYLK